MIICLTAFGKEHITEYNLLIGNLLKIDKDLKFIVTTDNPSQIDNRTYKIIEYKEPFNYNLKRVSIKEALKETDTVFYIDTDIVPRKGLDFSIVKTLPSNTFYIDELLDVDKQVDENGSLDYMKDYLNILYQNCGDLKLVNEGIFILKCDHDIAKKFIDTWEEIDLLTRSVQKERDGYYGVMEGFIIWIAIKKSGMEPHVVPENSELKKMFRKLVHIGQDGQKYIKTIL